MGYRVREETQRDELRTRTGKRARIFRETKGGRGKRVSDKGLIGGRKGKETCRLKVMEKEIEKAGNR